MKFTDFLLFVVLSLAIFFLFKFQLKQHEKVRCLTLYNQKESIGKIWYSAEWEKDMCSQYGIDLSN